MDACKISDVMYRVDLCETFAELTERYSETCMCLDPPREWLLQLEHLLAMLELARKILSLQ